MSDADCPLSLKDRLLVTAQLSKRPGRNGRSDALAADFELDYLLKQLQEEGDTDVLTAIVTLLGNWAGHDPDSTVVKALRHFLNDTDIIREQQAVVRTLGNWAGRDSFEIAENTLIEILSDQLNDERLHEAGVESLGKWARFDSSHEIYDRLVNLGDTIKSRVISNHSISEELTRLAQLLTNWVDYGAGDQVWKMSIKLKAWSLLTSWVGRPAEQDIVPSLALALGKEDRENWQPILQTLAKWDRLTLLRMADGSSSPRTIQNSFDVSDLLLQLAGQVTKLFKPPTKKKWSTTSKGYLERLLLAAALVSLPGHNHIADLEQVGFSRKILLEALEYHESPVRRAAVFVLGAWARSDYDHRVRDALIHQLGEPNQRVRKAIVATLGLWAKSDPNHAARDALLRRLSENSDDIRQTAINSLAQWVGHDADGRVLEALIREGAVQQVSYWAGHDSNNRARDALLDWASQPNRHPEFKEVFDALSRWAPYDADGQLLQTIIELLSDCTGVICEAAAETIGSWYGYDVTGQALQTLVGLTADECAEIRYVAADALSQWSTEELLKATSQGDWSEVERLSLLATALGGQGDEALLKKPPASVCHDKLIRAIQVCDIPFNQYAVRALGCYANSNHSNQVLQLVLDMAKDQHSVLCKFAIQALGCWAEHDVDGRVLQVVVQALSCWNTSVIQAASQTLNHWDSYVLLRAAQGLLGCDPSGPEGCKIPDWLRQQEKE